VIEADDDAAFADALAGLQRGDFSRLEPYFNETPFESGLTSQIASWHQRGRFAAHDNELAEALTCACFLGKRSVVDYLLAHGVSPAGGNGTGLNAIHWASNRGQLEVVRLLLRHHVDLEFKNMYGGTVLDVTAWSAVHEPRPHHREIVEELINAGAKVHEVAYPTGHAEIDAILRRHRSK
jgi:ankyrin repeat protein